MAEIQLDVRGIAKPDAYRALKEQFDAVCEGVTDPVAVMATMSCILHYGFGHLWTGFYRRNGPAQLIVGPYQGTLGCMDIAFGRGVCGTAAHTRKAVIVPDVRLFPGHIACDARSLSEIVVPVFDSRGEVMAVLDIDSVTTNTFDDEDRRQLEGWVARFSR
ncbi:MAG TPA: GAF domain-containing protein [Gemmatimonadaceae bacterium]|jgi:GAF domain-containing protein